ncbi:non-canonical purine NTP pyrophosphatase [Helicobacter jaachi]|uniref:dITP/XTP pyrophosphatase n=1 Tax=Helicobacter jaachi TaxID=1677920 RepID=A0A4U8T9S0_9HELI|nr:non-canonical purine NTP pyrophosphatase [Helicobacter jaachi]TLD96580.1 non-canonical purine NTP pyrophosphatase [Helicobacter jaachi]
MTIILATNNAHKIREFQAILKDEFKQHKNIRVCAYSDIIEPFEIIESGVTFKENATIKVKAIYEAIKHEFKFRPLPYAAPYFIIAEDSGLCVLALNGEPGIYSARYASFKHFDSIESSTDLANLHCLIESIKPIAPTPAYFLAHIAMIEIKAFSCTPSADFIIEHFEGKLKGSVIAQMRGNAGFGYDPIFIPSEDNPLGLSLAEYNPSAKNRISHRKKAISQCIEKILS